jgi:hypothetical protein
LKRYYIFFALLVVLAGAVAIAQTTLSRGYMADENKQSDLRELSDDVNQSASRDNALPEKLADVKVGMKLKGKLTDYSYSVSDYNKYKLCSTFTHERKLPAGQTPSTNDYYTDTTYHSAGHQCFSYTAPGVTPPQPFIQAPASLAICTVGARDQKWVFSDVMWDGYDPNAKTVSVHTKNQKQVFRWCADPVATNALGAAISLSAIPLGSKVTVNVTSPGMPRANGTVDYMSPYVTKVQVGQSSQAK